MALVCQDIPWMVLVCHDIPCMVLVFHDIMLMVLANNLTSLSPLQLTLLVTGKNETS
jgi:hypothetical protein